MKWKHESSCINVWSSDQEKFDMTYLSVTEFHGTSDKASPL